MPSPVRINVQGTSAPQVIVPGGAGAPVIVSPVIEGETGPVGPEGPAGPPGPAGGVVVSATEPVAPTVGMIWVKP
jgi:hypothetical protein